MLVFKQLKYMLIPNIGLLFFLGRGSPGRSHSGRALMVASPHIQESFSGALLSSGCSYLGDEHMLKCFVGLAPVKSVPAVANETKPENHSSLQANHSSKPESHLQGHKRHGVAAPLPLCGLTSSKEA